MMKGGDLPTELAKSARRALAAAGYVRLERFTAVSEAEEVVGGYAVHELESKDEAVEAAVWLMNLHKEHWPGWDGEVEVRRIFEAGGPRSRGREAVVVARLDSRP